MPPRLVISAPQGRSGKTIVSIGLCAALKRRGVAVQPFKKGPDYIDPSWLTAASGRDCRNLDTVLMPGEAMLASFYRACQGAGVAVIEGSMGLYDGIDASAKGSTAHVARLLTAPVIMVVNAARMTNSVAAMVGGYQNFEPDTGIAGVILNNVAGSRHEQKLVTAIERHCKIPVVGCVPKDASLSITERHLGLVPYGEGGREEIIDRICDGTVKYLRFDKIMDIARRAGEVCLSHMPVPEHKTATVKLGVIRDNIFTFYYPDNLEALEQAGADLVFVDSVHDRNLPDVDGLYIGGGFPELFLPELEANTGLRRSIAQAVENGLPVYAECAGLMYLCRDIRWRSKRYEMVGAIPAEVELCQRPQGHGYVQVEVAGDNPLLPAGQTFCGHEFHHSRLLCPGGLKFAYRLTRGHGVDGRHDGIVYKNVLASYTHLHALGVPGWADAFVSLMFRARQRSFSIMKS